VHCVIFNNSERIQDIVACKAVSRQRLGKHVPAATDTYATIEVLSETVFSTRSVQKGLYGGQLKKEEAVGREPPFRQDLSMEEV
jgi:hypothetical protein